MKLIIKYSEDVDFLTLWNGRLSDGGEDVSAGLTAFFDDSDDSIVSFTIQSAVKDLAPVLYGKESVGCNPVRRKVGQKGYLEDVPLLIDYLPESDTLRLWNGRQAARTQVVADPLTAEFDGEGEVVGLTGRRPATALPVLLLTHPGRDCRRCAKQVNPLLPKPPMGR